jgi:Tfp pilus assembly protein PilN
MDKTLTQLAASLTTKRLARLLWFFFCILITSTLSVLLIHSSLSRSYTHLEAHYSDLLATHKKLAEQWQLRATISKKIKALKKQPILDSPTPLLKKLAQSIPSRTLLTMVSYKDKNLTLQGYSSSSEELSRFLIDLSKLGLSTITLPITHQGPAGIFFEINSCY